MADPRGEQTVFADYVTDLVTAEDSRRASLEARGASVITASGGLVALFFALSALVTRQEGFTLPGGPRALLAVATAAFVAAAVLAIGTSVPSRARLVDPGELARQLPALWRRDDDFARRKTTMSRLVELVDTQRGNDVRARLLLAAITCQVSGVLLVAASVLLILGSPASR
ncbi:hypothetical protein [Cellulomonas cellasea]|uniref:Integral membrane plasmid transfer protein n=2 Tax=Cellulomonas cellasea TaxID=43670 RepID=A0A0A0BDL6_9CELL|nr:hypothetical protein [Cellulomonas cellasea]KGM03984.1 hypothetical protein Q760_00090 [Cellulomonas cellasea DSM 20118]GEA89053.1 hypothetical protein CCE01nite_30020 [Cellulomonas cellasea]